MNRMTGVSVSLVVTLAACGKEPQPRSVSQFLEDPIALEATLSRCNADRSRTRTDPECINARDATRRISAEEEAERRRTFEQQSQRKLDELRRRTEALEERLRRSEEEKRRMEELQYEQQFEAAAAEASGATTDAANAPAPSEPSNGPAPAAETAPSDVEESSGSDIGALREELRRRTGDEPEAAGAEPDGS